MKKYTKPMVKIVNIKSSEDIAAPTKFKAIHDGIIRNYLLNGETNYVVTQYSVGASIVEANN